MPRRGIMVCSGKKSRGFPLPPQVRSTDSMETEARTPCPCPWAWAWAHTPSSYSRQEGRAMPSPAALPSCPPPPPARRAPLRRCLLSLATFHTRQETRRRSRSFGRWFAGTLSYQAGGVACRPPPAMPHSIVLYKQRILAKIQKTLPRKKGKL